MILGYQRKSKIQQRSIPGYQIQDHLKYQYLFLLPTCHFCSSKRKLQNVDYLSDGVFILHVGGMKLFKCTCGHVRSGDAWAADWPVKSGVSLAAIYIRLSR